MFTLNKLSTIPFSKVLTALVLLAFSTQMTFAQQSDVRGRLLETTT